MNFAAFQLWREECLREQPDLLDCAETNLYQALSFLQPKADLPPTDQRVYRCDLARAWLARYGYPAIDSRRALVCGGVRHALGLIFRELARAKAVLWAPADVYPVYLELAQAAGIETNLYPTLPEPRLPAGAAGGARGEYLLIANPWKPLGRYLTNGECEAITSWLDASPKRQVLIDCVYDLGAPFHETTQALQRTGRAVLLHSVTKGWLRPRTFGVALIGEAHALFEAAFRADSPTQEQLRRAQYFLTDAVDCPEWVAAELKQRAGRFLFVLPRAARQSLLLKADEVAPGCYFFPVALPAEELLKQRRLLAIPASAFGAEWPGSILTSLAPAFGREEGGR